MFQEPTRALLELNAAPRRTVRTEGYDDSTQWELGHFLHLATKANPTVLEMFLAPVLTTSPEGEELRSLFPHVWGTDQVQQSFLGYASGQRKRFQAHKDLRAKKFAATYLRVLFWGWELLATGAFTVRVIDTEVGEIIRTWREGFFRYDEVLRTCEQWEEKLAQAYTQATRKEPDYPALNAYLLRMRQTYWD